MSDCGFTVTVCLISVSLQVPGVIDGSVVLPCSSAQQDLKLQDINVHWRHNNREIVYDIIKGEDSVEKQDPQYKNRAETFPEEYKRGNFSIKLNNLQHTDAGKFSCFITPSNEQETVELRVNGFFVATCVCCFKRATIHLCCVLLFFFYIHLFFIYLFVQLYLLSFKGVI
uniref:Ig-like domain-containing protein n=1 Tax=Sinocyclocheilus rhinocerous TaxID=307959 RepID=A0A673HS97_9TELE